MSSPEIGEDELIARFFAPIAGRGGLSLLDDAALIQPPSGTDLVVTADALVADVHFFADDSASSIAKKSLAVNLSDLAAKGAAPLGFTLALALPVPWSSEWLKDFAAGLSQFADAHGCPLVGGDTVRMPGPLTIAITAFGAVPSGRMVPRTGVRPGDRLYVTGTIGDAALGLLLRLDERARSEVPARRDLAPKAREFLLHRYLHPQPRLGLRAALLEHAHAGMDVSDGFVGDLRKMLRASGCSAEVRLPRVPLSEPAQAMIGADPALFETAVTGGDDYEILAAVPVEHAVAYEAVAKSAGIAVTQVGAAESGTLPPRFLDDAGREVRYDRGSFSHF